MSHYLEEKEPLIVYEICKNIERIPQPEGEEQFNPTKTGDCFLCSSYAIISHFCKERSIQPPTKQQVYEVWASEDVNAGSGSNYWSNERFWNYFNHLSKWWDIAFEMVIDPPVCLDRFNEFPSAFGPRLYTPSALTQRVKTYLEAGYLIHAEVQHRPTSEYIKEGKRADGSDHLVVIDGIRTVVDQKLMCMGDGKTDPSWFGHIKNQIHIVDSARKKPEPYWIDVNTYVEEHGGFCMWFIRPNRDLEYSFPKSYGCQEHPVGII